MVPAPTSFIDLSPDESSEIRIITSTSQHSKPYPLICFFAMGNDDLLTDDYVADLLAKEASDCSLKYSTMGMEAYTSSSSSSSRCVDSS